MELLGLNLTSAYQIGFLYLRSLCLHLREIRNNLVRFVSDFVDQGRDKEYLFMVILQLHEAPSPGDYSTPIRT